MVGTTGWVLQKSIPKNGYNFSSKPNAMKTIHDIKTLAKQYALHKQKYAELKEGQQKPSSLRVCPFSGYLRSSESLGLKSLITPTTIHRMTNLRLNTVPYFPVLPGLPFEPKSDIPRLHKSSIQGFHVQDRSDHPKPSEQLGRLDIIVKPILQG